MNMKKKNLIILLAGICTLSGCDDLFTPAVENFKTESQMVEEPDFGKGFMMYAYRALPDYYTNIEYATDDAVANQEGNSYRNMALGNWTASNNPVSYWSTGLDAIQYLNIYLSKVDQMEFVKDPVVNTLTIMRTKGEAYALRAIHSYYLLRAHAGRATNGELLGIPILTEFQGEDADFNQPRTSFANCVKHALDDLALAEENLPDEYEDVDSDRPQDIPGKFRNITEEPSLYNQAMGNSSRLLVDGLIVKAWRARILLLAASPAFQDPSNPYKWEEAAEAAAEVIDYNGGAGNLAGNGLTYYCNTADFNEISENSNPSEIIWRKSLMTNNNSYESNFYPPTLFGSGRMNPSQNLVDAFPMLDGYPIGDSRGSYKYDANNPFANRDPRLGTFIIYNGSTAGINDDVIRTGSLSGTSDGVNVTETSTRTGYYMKKRLNMGASCNPSATVGVKRYEPRIRYTEIYLAYAEAANEAYGPKGTGTSGYSAYDIIRSIRRRAGIGGLTDAYLETCAGSTETMRELIRNERRLELSFEGFRFWDLRRWKVDLDKLNETVRGIDVDSKGTYSQFDVERRYYQSYMYYGPIPRSEILKYSNLLQNEGWN